MFFKILAIFQLAQLASSEVVVSSLHSVGGKNCSWPTQGVIAHNAVLFMMGDTLMGCGGENECWVFDPQLRAWTQTVGNMNVPRRGWTGLQLDQNRYWLAGLIQLLVFQGN